MVGCSKVLEGPFHNAISLQSSKNLFEILSYGKGQQHSILIHQISRIGTDVFVFNISCNIHIVE